MESQFGKSVLPRAHCLINNFKLKRTGYVKAMSSGISEW